MQHSTTCTRIGFAVVALVGLWACGPKLEGGRGTGQIPQLGSDSQTGTADDASSDYEDCIEVELDERIGYLGGGGGQSAFGQSLDEDLEIGDEDADSTVDFFVLEFRSPATGDFELASEDNDDYSRCQQCVHTWIDGQEKRLFQAEGSIEIAEDARLSEGDLKITFTDVVLVEAEIDLEDLSTEIDEDGICVRIVDATVRELKSEPGWTCPRGFFDTGDGCDCGCGKRDPDCDGAGIDACDYCNNQGSCNCSVPGKCVDPGDPNGECGGSTIDADNNGQCDPEASWTCDFAKYGANDGCDCGCGIVDSDCQNEKSKHCDNCGLEGSCVEGAEASECGGLIPLYNSATCSPFPGWTCDPLFYASEDGCDCGCGIPDPDCSDEKAQSCDFCTDEGGCGEGGDEDVDCTDVIRANDNTACK